MKCNLWSSRHFFIFCDPLIYFVVSFYFLVLGREAPSLKMGSVCFSYYFLGGSTFRLLLIGWRATNMSWMSSGEERNVGERSVLCLPNLALWTGLLERSYHVKKGNDGCGGPTLNFIERLVFIMLSSLSVVWLPCRTNYIRYVSKLWCA